MKKILFILAFAALACASEIEEANLSKNWSTTQNNPWLYQYFMGNGTRINMTQAVVPGCDTGIGSSFECWSTGEASHDQTATSLFPTTYNISIMTGSTGGVVFPNIAFKYFFTKPLGNYSANISFTSRGGICVSSMNYTIRKDASIVCSGNFIDSLSLQTVGCVIGTKVAAGSSVEVAIGSGADSNGDCANMTLMIYEDHTQRLIMQAQDEQTLANRLFNLQISNGTNTTSYLNQYWFNRTAAEIPTGNLTVTVSNSSYFSRNYFVDFNPAGIDTNITAFLLNTSDAYAHLVSLSVKDSANVPLQNALIQVQKEVGGIFVDVGSGLTDSSGTVSFFLDALTAYQIVISKAGFTTSISTLIPASTQYTFQLFSSTGGPGYTGLFEDTTYSLNPQTLSNYSIVLTATTTSSSLAYTALRLTLGNGTQIFYSNDTTSILPR